GLIDTSCRTCTATLGDHRCKVNLIPYRVTLTPQSVSAWVISSGVVAGYADGWFTGGYVEWQVDGDNYDRRYIERHAGADLHILGGTEGVPAGGQLRVYPGCDLLDETCAGKFDNILNFRGFNKMQGKSPFDGDQVW
ncbi:phage BR0599 family protein, partial [Pseudomonas aeruginosa]|nr:phage BR0599 family protein [Pseudomonas aeruginosa]MDG3657702.1 phage BR0599 family protein [Pseudomonas aeruginosa]MDG3808918.1 phage BR0599 family protein [Pseudomonas aeruginosa]